MYKTIKEHMKDAPEGLAKTVDQVYEIVVRGYEPQTWCGTIERHGRRGNYKGALFEDTTSINLETDVALQNIVYTLTGMDTTMPDDYDNAEEAMLGLYAAEHSEKLQKILQETYSFVKRHTAEKQRMLVEAERKYGGSEKVVQHIMDYTQKDLEQTLVRIDRLLEKVQK